MKITAAAASAVLFVSPAVLATPAQADPTCHQFTGRLSVCQPDPPSDPKTWPLVLPEGYRGAADQNGSCGAFSMTCVPPCNMMRQVDGELVPNPHRGVGEWCNDTGAKP